jgi:hypothetical protein
MGNVSGVSRKDVNEWKKKYKISDEKVAVIGFVQHAHTNTGEMDTEGI